MGPRFLEIELTGRCLLRCHHCYRDSPFPIDLPGEKVEQIIDQAGENFDCLIFSGGEPFLHPDIVELVRHADHKGFSVHITTSGYCIPGETLDSLSDNVVLVFGLDGIGPTHDAYRGKEGAYQELMKTMAHWQNRPHEIITTLWKGVINELDEIAGLALEGGAGLHLNALIPVGRARRNARILLSREENERVRLLISELKQRHPMIITDHYKITEKDLYQGIDLFCKRRFSIDPQGNVHPCEFLRTRTFGNVFQDDVSRIIRRARKTSLIRARENGFREYARTNLADPFDYHTGICHPLARKDWLAQQPNTTHNSA